MMPDLLPHTGHIGALQGSAILTEHFRKKTNRRGVGSWGR